MTVAIVGAGIMGRGIAQTFAAAGHTARLHDADAGARRAAVEHIDASLQRAVARGRMDDDERRAVLQRIEVPGDLPGTVGGVEAVIEAVTEDLALKQRLFTELAHEAAPGAILATNTSALSVTAIASATSCPERVVGLHFFNPVPRLPLVEVVRGMQTAEATVDRAVALCEQAGKETVTVADRPGFATSRLNALLGNEAFYMLMEGVATAEDIDRSAKLGLNHPMGPLELADLVGLDTRLAVLEHLHARLGDKFRPCPLLVTYVEAGRLGRKTGIGVYRYDEDGARMPDDR